MNNLAFNEYGFSKKETEEGISGNLRDSYNCFNLGITFDQGKAICEILKKRESY